MPDLMFSERAHRLIPSGALCWSKDDDHFPAVAPRFLEEGAGAHVYEPDGTKWLDWGMGLRSVILGYGNERVTKAALRWIDNGPNFTRPTLLEGELAERLINLYPIPNAMAKFGKNGSDAVTAAVRLARAFTGRTRILVCADPFHASDDWWLSTQTRSAGTVEQGTRLFTYNSEPWFDDIRGDFAAVVMEPMSFEWPRPRFLERMRDWCTRTGKVLIFDEVITGFRFGMGGGAGYFGVMPDLACFGKAIANGFSVSALVGRREIMTTPNVHALSSTHGGETHALAAALATIDELELHDVPRRIAYIGGLLQAGLRQAGYHVGGYPASPMLRFTSEDDHLDFIAKMCVDGILAPYWAPSLAHTEADVDRTVAAAVSARERAAWEAEVIARGKRQEA